MLNSKCPLEWGREYSSQRSECRTISGVLGHRSVLYMSTVDMSTNKATEKGRAPQRHPRPSGPQDTRHHGSAARLQPGPAHRADVRKRAPPQPGVDLPGADPARAAGAGFTTEWGVSETNRKVKFYALTKAARASSRSEVATGSRPSRSSRASWAPRHEPPAGVAPGGGAGPPAPARSRARRRSGRAPGAGRARRRGPRADRRGGQGRGAALVWRRRADEGAPSRRP